MAKDYPRLMADDKGVWRQDKPNGRFGIEWDEIVRIVAYRLDGVTELFTVVELNFEWGSYVELNDSWLGFTAVATAITERFAGIEPQWLQQANELSPTDLPLIVWEHANSR